MLLSLPRATGIMSIRSRSTSVRSDGSPEYRNSIKHADLPADRSYPQLLLGKRRTVLVPIVLTLIDIDRILIIDHT